MSADSRKERGYTQCPKQSLSLSLLLYLQKDNWKWLFISVRPKVELFVHAPYCNHASVPAPTYGLHELNLFITWGYILCVFVKEKNWKVRMRLPEHIKQIGELDDVQDKSYFWTALWTFRSMNARLGYSVFYCMTSYLVKIFWIRSCCFDDSCFVICKY